MQEPVYCKLTSELIKEYPTILENFELVVYTDKQNKIVYKMQATRRKELEKMEEDLSSLLTNEKQTEIKVDSIADLLGKM